MYCWLGSADDSLKQTIGIMMLINLYIPLLISAIFIIFTVSRVIKYVQTSTMETDLEFVKRLRLYPLVLIVCWSPAAINRVVMYLTGEEYVWLRCFHLFFSRIEGLMHLLVYGMTSLVQMVIKEKIVNRYFHSDNQPTVTELSQMGFQDSRRSTVSEAEMPTSRELHERINSFFERKRIESNIPDDQ